MKCAEQRRFTGHTPPQAATLQKRWLSSANNAASGQNYEPMTFRAGGDALDDGDEARWQRANANHNHLVTVQRGTELTKGSQVSAGALVLLILPCLRLQLLLRLAFCHRTFAFISTNIHSYPPAPRFRQAKFVLGKRRIWKYSAGLFFFHDDDLASIS